MRMTVIGMGYLGLTHAVCMAQCGHIVVGIDTNVERIAVLQRGQQPFYEPGLAQACNEMVQAGRLRFSSDPQQATRVARVHFVAVGTPQSSQGLAADISDLHAAVGTLARSGSGHLVIGKSTVPVGTAAQLQQEFPELQIVWNPEFLREGHGLVDTVHPDRIVIGLPEQAISPMHHSQIAQIMAEIYAPIDDNDTPIIYTDLVTAELAKSAANAFLATKISFINAIDDVCRATGADIRTLSRILGLDPRIGQEHLNAGLGFGGGCLPKDLRALLATSTAHGCHTTAALLHAVDTINNNRPSHLVDTVAAALSQQVAGATIAILGCSFKPHSDDIRHSPALAVAAELSARGATVRIYDPEAMPRARAHYPTFQYAATAADALRGVDLVVLATEWPQLCQLNPNDTAGLVTTPIVVDARNALDGQQWRDAGWRYYS